MTKVLALTIPEREMIIRALDEPPPGLQELRAVLLREHVGRVRDGLVWSESQPDPTASHPPARGEPPSGGSVAPGVPPRARTRL
jgi:hypothetical protein